MNYSEPLMAPSLLSLPPELIDPIVRHLDGGDLCSIRLTCQYLCKASDRTFIEHISSNQYFLLQDSLQKLEKISSHAYFRDVVDSLRIHPHSLTWNSSKPFPALAREEVDYTRWLTHPLTSAQRKSFRSKLLQQLHYTHSRADLAALVSSVTNLSKLSRIEVGSWGPSLSDVETRSSVMRMFHEETNLRLLHFDWRTVAEAKARGTRSSCDGDCSLTEDFNLILQTLSQTRTPLSELKAHYWSDTGLKCVQVSDVPLPKDMLQALTPVLSNLRVLHLCLGFERGRRSPVGTGSLTEKKTWLSDLLCTTPQLEDLKLVFDGWAQWEVRAEPEAPDWSGSVFHHVVSGTPRLHRLRKLDLQNMFVRWLDVSRFLEMHRESLEEVSLNRMNIWNVLSWTHSPPDTDMESWIVRLKSLLGTMPALRSINLSWLCVNGRMMCFYQNHFRHCSGCDDNVSSKPTDYGISTCPHYAFGENRDANFLRGAAAKIQCGPNTACPKDLMTLPVVMIPMHKAFPLYYQADENDHEAQWQYYDGTVGRWETPGPELQEALNAEGGYFGLASMD